MALVARQIYFEAVRVGDELPPLVKPPVDRSQIARYAGASGDFGPLHVDEPFARNAGFPGVLVPGMLAMGFLGPEKPMLQQIGVRIDERGNVWTDEEKMTSVPGIFAAGDASRGQSLVVWAIHEGRRAARGVDKYLMQGESYLPG